MNRIDSVRIEGSLPSPVSCAVLRLLARAAFSLLMAVGSLCNSPNISTTLTHHTPNTGGHGDVVQCTVVEDSSPSFIENNSYLVAVISDGYCCDTVPRVMYLYNIYISK